MKYLFTKEWYKQMQVYGYLTFHESKEEWDNDITWYQSEGRNYEEESMVGLEYYKQDLLKFLPDTIHPYIHNGALKSQFPSTELRIMVEQWKREYNERNRNEIDKYRNYYESIKDKLPENIVLLFKKTLHDSRVLSLNNFSEDTFFMVLDCTGGYHYHNDIKLTFLRVKTLDISEVIVGSSWIYNEVYLTDTGYELHVLFDSPLGEMTIKAEDIQIEIFNN